MTSCDGNLMKFIPIQLESITSHLQDTNVNFYLFHDGKNQNYVNLLKKLTYDNITFNDVIVKDTEIYESIAKYGGSWCGAAYYSLCAYKYLPSDMERILYIDAADVLIIDNIDDYYFTDFEDNALIVTGGKFKLFYKTAVPYEQIDILNKLRFEELALGIFNSGSYIINLNKMREQNYSIDDYLKCAEILYKLSNKDKKTKIYLGDQGFMSFNFVGAIKYLDYPEIINLWHMPYNFCLWYFDKMKKKPNYKISILHYAGVPFKPWVGIYPVFLERFQDENKMRNLNELKLGQAEYYYLWHEYAILADMRLDACAIEGL